MSKTTTDQIVKRIWKEAYLCNVPDHERLIQEFCDQQTSELKAENERLERLMDTKTNYYEDKIEMMVRNGEERYKEITALTIENTRLWEEMDRYIGATKVALGQAGVIASIKSLAFADHDCVEYNMEEIRKILNNQK